ncbi:hypothetical protein [Kocuria flava]|uniref:hypothetical protein n=1 Tax=Kocuria flava TaxID=446860 RepID=UPI002F94A25A
MSERPALEDNELLHRQVHPNWLKAGGGLMSIAFCPTPKDDRKLSTMRDKLSSAEESYRRHTGDGSGLQSAGTWSVSHGEVEQAELDCDDDGGCSDLPWAHASIVFSEDFSRKQMERKAAQLRNRAEERGKQYPAG